MDRVHDNTGGLAMSAGCCMGVSFCSHLNELLHHFQASGHSFVLNVIHHELVAETT